jgi:hypothetical protein
MGTWETGPFGNDDAMDFFERVEEADGADVVATLRATLSAVIDRPGKVEVHEGHVAVAAASLVAAGRSRLAQTGNALVDAWLAEHRPTVSDDDQRLALKALDRVSGPDSEWQQLWSTTRRGADIDAKVAELRAVLRG